MSNYTRIHLWMCLAGAGLLSVAPSTFAGPADCDIGFHCNFNCGGVRASLGPWYAYFPYDAHFQMPAPVGMYPNWPPMFPPGAPAWAPPGLPAPFPPPPTPVPPAPPPGPRTAPTNQALIQPVGYNPYGYGYGYQVPSYWYGR